LPRSMGRGGSISRTVCLVAALVAAAVPLSACGKQKEKNPAVLPAKGPGVPVGAPTPREAIIQFFAAKRTAQTGKGCSLESKDFQVAQYNGVGPACLRSSVNQHPQKVWAVDIKIDKLDVAPDSAAAKIRPNAGNDTPAEITLVRGEGGWLVESLR
jgi:hypothetical protein